MKNQVLRIIGGKWKSRQLTFPSNVAHLRPTSDRIRETLFNWLQYEIIGCDCLDLFAGSGALGLEALSRGAKHVTFIEKARSAYLQLKKNLNLLNAQNTQCIQGDAYKVLQQSKQQFDLIFLDPPFNQNTLPKLLEIIKTNEALKPDGMIYFEADSKSDLTSSLTSGDWQLIKNKVTGNVRYGLIKQT